MSWAWPKMRRWYGILLAILNIPLRIVLWKILYWVSWLEYICWKVLATSLTLREPGMVGGMHLNYSSFYILVSQFFVIKSIKFSTFNTILLWKPWLIRFQILIINFQTICTFLLSAWMFPLLHITGNHQIYTIVTLRSSLLTRYRLRAIHKT